MDKETKAQAIYADMVRQAGDAVEGLREVFESYHNTEKHREQLAQATLTLRSLVAFIQGIQATQGLMQSQPLNQYLAQAQPMDSKAFEHYTTWLNKRQEKEIPCTCSSTDGGLFIMCEYCEEHNNKEYMIRNGYKLCPICKEYYIPKSRIICSTCTKKDSTAQDAVVEEIQHQEKVTKYCYCSALEGRTCGYCIGEISKNKAIKGA